MATPLSEVIDVIETLKSADVLFSDAKIPYKHAKFGVTQASISLGKDFPVTITITEDADGTETVTGEIGADLSDKEVLLCGLYAYRSYAMQEHHSLTQKAVNFKTINFAVSGLTERAKEAMRIVWWLDTEIAKVLQSVADPIGASAQMGGVENG